MEKKQYHFLPKRELYPSQLQMLFERMNRCDLGIDDIEDLFGHILWQFNEIEKLKLQVEELKTELYLDRDDSIS